MNGRGNADFEKGDESDELRGRSRKPSKPKAIMNRMKRVKEIKKRKGQDINDALPLEGASTSAASGLES